MTKVIKDGIVMVARDGNQLAAFLNNGWKKAFENDAIENDVKTNDVQATVSTNADNAGAAMKEEKPRRGRKPVQKSE